MRLTAKYLDKKGIRHTISAEGRINVGGGLDLRGTGITELPEGLNVGGYLDLSSTGITELPEGLNVGGYLDLRGMSITELPKDLNVGGGLDLRGTSITELPECLNVGGGLDLRHTSITELPEGLNVGGSLYLRGTGITELPEGLNVGGYLDLSGMSITELPKGLNVGEIYFKGELGGRVFDIIDGIPCVVISVKQKNGITVKRCQGSKVVDGEISGKRFYVASNEEHNAHGETIREATDDLAFKSGDRDVSEFKGMALDTVKTPNEWSFIYRRVTGACREGTAQFMKSKKLKKNYKLSEIIDMTKGKYGGAAFEGFFKDAAYT